VRTSNTTQLIQDLRIYPDLPIVPIHLGIPAFYNPKWHLLAKDLKAFRRKATPVILRYRDRGNIEDLFMDLSGQIN